MRILCILALLCFTAYPGFASEFVIQADSEVAIQQTMLSAQSLSQQDKERFTSLSMIVMNAILEDQRAKGQMNEAEMDAAIKRIMHGKTLDQLEAYVKSHIEQ